MPNCWLSKRDHFPLPRLVVDTPTTSVIGVSVQLDSYTEGKWWILSVWLVVSFVLGSTGEKVKVEFVSFVLVGIIPEWWL